MAAINSKNILLVDDNPLFLKLLGQAFTKAGFTCQVAHSAHEALIYMQCHTPDVIVSDYDMPEMNGLEFRRSVLAVENLKDIPFMFLTGFDDEKVMYTGLHLQAIDYVIKDTPVEVIIAKINNLLHTVNKQRELSETEIKKTVAALNIKAVPAKAPQVAGISIDFWHHDYQDIPGGDFIDFIDTANRHLFIVLGDVMGKKWKAWFYTFTYLSYIRAAIRFSASGEDNTGPAILQKINEVIYNDDGLQGILSSVSLICIDKQTGQLRYTGAGDLPLLHYSARSLQLNQVGSSGLLLGLTPNGNYTDQEINLAEGDLLFMFTDGLIDIAATDGSKSDYNLFAAKLTAHLHSGQTFQEFKRNLEQQSTTLVDDSSIICIYKPVPYA
ncbi:SpoIIE family protein phosphatase [Mucilaginibacter terrae]|uniref:SpoIIE family protein phosphatase n=1 Tax=Mucilaginibacter terrae TaxID=1955052 RepID=UPI003635AC36